MKRQVVVIGLGRFGFHLAEVLFNSGHEVLALDRNEKKVQSIASRITHAAQADATDEEVLKELGASNFDTAVVAIGAAIQSSVMSTILLKKLGVRYVIARAENELHGSILEKIGADKVVYIEHEIGTKVAHELNMPDVLDYMPVASGYGIAKLAPPPHFVGKTLSDIGLGQRVKRGVAVLLIKREKEVIITPGPDETVVATDVLFVSGEDGKLEQLLVEAQKP